MYHCKHTRLVLEPGIPVLQLIFGDTCFQVRLRAYVALTLIVSLYRVNPWRKIILQGWSTCRGTSLQRFDKGWPTGPLGPKYERMDRDTICSGSIRAYLGMCWNSDWLIHAAINQMVFEAVKLAGPSPHKSSFSGPSYHVHISRIVFQCSRSES